MGNPLSELMRVILLRVRLKHISYSTLAILTGILNGGLGYIHTL
jgi:hypothetical protein